MFMSRAKATPQRRPYFHALFLSRPMHLLLENGHLSLVTIEQMKSDICKSEKPLHSEWDWFKMTSKEKDLIQDNLMNENSPIKSYPFPETDHFQTVKYSRTDQKRHLLHKIDLLRMLSKVSLKNKNL